MRPEMLLTGKTPPDSIWIPPPHPPKSVRYVPLVFSQKWHHKPTITRNTEGGHGNKSGHTCLCPGSPALLAQRLLNGLRLWTRTLGPLCSCGLRWGGAAPLRGAMGAAHLLLPLRQTAALKRMWCVSQQMRAPLLSDFYFPSYEHILPLTHRKLQNWDQMPIAAALGTSRTEETFPVKLLGRKCFTY